MRLLGLAVFMMMASCSFINHPIGNTVEFSKSVWGSSTRALEGARDRAITKTYDQSYWDCVRSSIAFVKHKNWVIFKKDEIKGYLVIMGVPGAVNTTEIGVFFDELSDKQTRVEVASLSTNAKRRVSKYLFHGLDIAFGIVPPDSPEIDKIGNAPDPAQDAAKQEAESSEKNNSET